MSIRKRVESPKTPNGTLQHTEKVEDARTDLTRWRLKDDRGRHTWHYLESDEELKQWPMTAADKYFLGLETASLSLMMPLWLPVVMMLTKVKGSTNTAESRDTTPGMREWN